MRIIPPGGVLPFALAPLLVGAAAPAQQVQFMADQGRQPSFLSNTISVVSAAVADLDGDGDADVAAASPFGALIYRNEVGGFVETQVSTGTSTSANRRVSAIDIDGDGDVDIVLSPRDLQSTTDVILLSNLGGGVFAQVAFPFQSNFVQAAAAGDVDGDGDVDFVVSRAGGLQVTQGLQLVRFGLGLYQVDTAALPQSLPAGTWPLLADFDGDGDVDILAVGAAGGLVYLRNQFGLFSNQSATMPAVPVRHVHAEAADLDGDGRIDVAAVAPNGDVDVLWNGAAGFALQSGVVTGTAALRIGVGDVDGDGDRDLIAFLATGFAVLRNRGQRQFAAETPIDGGAAVQGEGIGDLNGDGAADVLTCYLDDRVRCAFGGARMIEDAAGGRGFRFQTDLGEAISSSIVGDFDGDGRADVLVPRQTGIDVQLARGGGRYATARTVATLQPTPFPLPVCRAADLDGDGDLDLVAQNGTDLRFFANNGAGTFTGTLTRSAPSASVVDALQLADVDADGDVDLVYRLGSTISLLRNQGGFASGAPVTLVTTGGSPTPGGFELVDLDGDGDADLVFQSPGAANMVLLNDGAGNFAGSSTLVLTINRQADVVTTIDFDGDGRRDVLIGGNSPPGGNSLGLYRNLGNGSFQDVTATVLPTLQALLVQFLGVVDVDGDGDEDIVIGDQLGQQPTLLVNDGAGRFLNLTSSRVSAGVAAVVGSLGDVDGDGDVDLLGTEGTVPLILLNHLRHLVVPIAARAGQSLLVTTYSGPGFSSQGIGLLAVSLGPSATPVSFPGIDGTLQIDPLAAAIVGFVPTAQVGVSQLFLPMPANPRFIGAELWFQNAIVPAAPTAIGFGNATFERILP